MTKTPTDSRALLEELLAERILLLDGSMGALIYSKQPTEDDYRGSVLRDHPRPLKNCTEALVLSQPQLIEDIHRAYLDAGAELIMIESEGITENVRTWRTDVASRIADELGLDKVMFEAADPEVFGWYVKNYGPEVNLFVDHSQVVQLQCLRAGIWGTQSLWGRVLAYKG